MKKQKPVFVYQIDPNDHTRVIAWWESISKFNDFIARIPVDYEEYEMYWCFSSDYDRVNGPIIDNKTPRVTKDPRFCTSRWYRGEVSKYSLSGDYIETISVNEFLEMGCGLDIVGNWHNPWGWPEFHGRFIQVRRAQKGFHWDFARQDSIITLMIPERFIDTVDPVRLQMLNDGEIIPYNPIILERGDLARARTRSAKKYKQMREEKENATRIAEVKPIKIKKERILTGGRKIAGKIEYTCTHCGHIGKGPQMFRWHMGNCKKTKEVK